MLLGVVGLSAASEYLQYAECVEYVQYDRCSEGGRVSGEMRSREENAEAEWRRQRQTVSNNIDAATSVTHIAASSSRIITYAITYQCAIMCASCCAAAWLRRHLMVWAIFAPKVTQPNRVL